MKKTIAEVTSYIQRHDLDNSMYNVEIDEMPESIYGNNLSNERMIKPHIALYHDAEYPDKIYDKCDYALLSKELGAVYIYEF